METLVHMSSKEINRLEVMHRLAKKQMRQPEAGTILNLSVRQIKRLLKAYRSLGVAGLISKQRGRKSNNRLSEKNKQQALDALQTKYQGFGPTLAHVSRQARQPRSWWSKTNSNSRRKVCGN